MNNHFMQRAISDKTTFHWLPVSHVHNNLLKVHNIIEIVSICGFILEL